MSIDFSTLKDSKEFQTFLAEFKQEIIQDTLRCIPEILVSLSVKNAAVDKLYKDFFEANKSFIGRELEVAKAVEELELANPLASLDQILNQVAGYIERTSLNIPVNQPTSLEETEAILNGQI